MINIRLFGHVRVVAYRELNRKVEVLDPAPGRTAGGGEVRLGRLAQGLIAYLALNGGELHSRDCLTEAFWGGGTAEHMRACLNTALWRLRRALEPDRDTRGRYILTDGASAVGLNLANVGVLDVADLEEAVRPLLARTASELSPADAQRAERAIGGCAGTLLDDLPWEWVVAERERLRCLRLDGMARLLAWHRLRGAHVRAIACAQAILQEDPLREDVHRDLMRLYLETGQRAQAVRQYEACWADLARELGIPPMLETQQVAAQMLVEVGRPAQMAAGGARLEEAMAAVRAAQEQLQAAIRMLGEAMGENG